MDKSCKLTIYFEEPFWVGIFELKDGNTLEVAKVVFGSEPKDPEVYQYVLKNWNTLRFSPPVAYDKTLEKNLSPKRMQRAINTQLSKKGIGTKAQNALKLQHEQSAQKRKTFNKEKLEAENKRKFEIKQLKKKQKHKGR